ncbi:MAG: 4-hydroxy-tetrahydrodipicolinate reductase [Ruminococcaceae bacterium]|nr:4-hydroxy-tetrahydrodipicolinate reductase [Oscillospiraceae bacterium]
MTKIIINGCNGKMGRAVASAINTHEDCSIFAGVDVYNKIDNPFPTFDTIGEVNGGDVIVDFSNPSSLPDLLEYAVATKTPIVIATTGYSEADIANIKEAAKAIPVFFTFNMSLGINLLCSLAVTASKILGGGFDVEIVEKHHNQKVDAPSGTAIMLANAINEANDNKYKYVYDRHSIRERRSANEIGMHAVRGGSIVGDHDVIFAGHDEVITLSHSAYSKEVFAVGAVNAAVFIAGKPAGLYDMKDLIENK